MTNELVKSSVNEENEFSGFYLIENINTGDKKLFDAREKSEAIAKAIDNPQLGFKVELVAPTWEAKRVAVLQDLGMTKEEAENDFLVKQTKKVDDLGQKLKNDYNTEEE